MPRDPAGEGGIADSTCLTCFRAETSDKPDPPSTAFGLRIRRKGVREHFACTCVFVDEAYIWSCAMSPQRRVSSLTAFRRKVLYILSMKTWTGCAVADPNFSIHH